MSLPNQPHPDEPVTREPPAQPMAPAPDLQFAALPPDPIGMSRQPVPSSKPARRDEPRTSRAGLWIGLGVVALIIVGVVTLFWLNS